MREDLTRLLLAVELHPADIEKLVVAAVDEDLAGGVDATTLACVPSDRDGIADVRARSGGVLAGVPVALAVFDAVSGGSFEIVAAAADASTIEAGETALSVHAHVRPLLTAERTALNLLGHLSGIATLTAAWVRAVEGTGARVRDTRKTTPGLRALEKYAVRCGGGVNHRMALSDAALVKDNHVLAAGGVAQAFALVREAYPGLPVEVECDDLDQVVEAVRAGADLILLDNMSVDELRRAVDICAPAGVRTEASGGLTLAAAREVAETGVDFLSVGALTHSAPVLDLGFDLVPLAGG